MSSPSPTSKPISKEVNTELSQNLLEKLKAKNIESEVEEKTPNTRRIFPWLRFVQVEIARCRTRVVLKRSSAEDKKLIGAETKERFLQNKPSTSSPGFKFINRTAERDNNITGIRLAGRRR